jgi:predicted nuclease of predicted toxin-antitoxin system
VKMLFDQNLSRHLVGRVSDEFFDSRHVTETGLDPATEDEIWAFAGEHGFVIVPEDSDFRQLAFLNGPPPKAVWLQLGNASTNEIHTAKGDNQDVKRPYIHDRHPAYTNEATDLLCQRAANGSHRRPNNAAIPSRRGLGWHCFVGGNRRRIGLGQRSGLVLRQTSGTPRSPLTSPASASKKICCTG